MNNPTCAGCQTVVGCQKNPVLCPNLGELHPIKKEPLAIPNLLDARLNKTHFEVDEKTFAKFTEMLAPPEYTSFAELYEENAVGIAIEHIKMGIEKIEAAKASMK